MPEALSQITHVSDTALLVAGARAVESERADAFVRDPFAARLAGERGKAMFEALPHREMMGFGIAVRTRFVDELLLNALINTGAKTVLSVGSGLDTRPWRLELPADLRWIEVDFPAMLDYKDSLMAGEKPRCHRGQLTADLNIPSQRRAIFSLAGTGSTMMITEGLLLYLPGSTVEAIAREARQLSGISHWISDLTTTSFSKAIGGDGARTVRQVQASDCLPGEQILATIYRQGWVTEARRSYLTDMAFATERIGRMMSNPKPSQPPPPFSPGDPSGVHRFMRDSREKEQEVK